MEFYPGRDNRHPIDPQEVWRFSGTENGNIGASACPAEVLIDMASYRARFLSFAVSGCESELGQEHNLYG